MKEYKIEKGVPLEQLREYGTWSTLARQMKVGDSVLVENFRAAVSLKSTLVQKKMKASLRQEITGQYRVWRVK